MTASYEYLASHGLYGTGAAAIAKACGIPGSTLFYYFGTLDELIIESTAFCMSKVEDEFMAKAPTSADDIKRFVEEVPYWTAQTHGAKYRLMYQVYTHPKYAEHGKTFFAGVEKRYAEYAKQLEPSLGIPADLITPLIFILIRACVHYSMFESEQYLRSQIDLLEKGISLLLQEHGIRQTVSKFSPKEESK